MAAFCIYAHRSPTSAFSVRRQTYRLNTENGSGTALRGCERIIEVYDYCRRRK
uniref:Uncharacterized protein n=1 Tax=Siphoviridae sp. ctOVO10 TaxID=2826311 RepID=A0A8S5M2Z3_9CAUD|nr:MAG TPA: hypothetical protein [Siphoviridae sp. ctOVO10]DAP46502.1 MAG TPA: hypothetical protein [Caudoviricetes sp.]